MNVAMAMQDLEAVAQREQQTRARDSQIRVKYHEERINGTLETLQWSQDLKDTHSQEARAWRTEQLAERERCVAP